MDETLMVRKAFIPSSKNAVLLSIDFSNIEYRLLAHFCKDPALLQVFREGGDFHGLVAQQLFGVEKPTKDQRSIGKRFNFAQLYGSGIANLSLKTGIPEDRCEQLVDLYYRKFPGVLDFKRAVTAYTKKNGKIVNPFGRERVIPYKFAFTGVNSLIQSTAADMLKIAMLRVWQFLRDKFSKLQLCVHDELVIDWVQFDGNIVPDIVRIMETWKAGDKDLFLVPIVAEASVCKDNWAQKEPFDWRHEGDAKFFAATKREEILNCVRNTPYWCWVQAIGETHEKIEQFVLILLRGVKNKWPSQKILADIRAAGGPALEVGYEVSKMPWEQNNNQLAGQT